MNFCVVAYITFFYQSNVLTSKFIYINVQKDLTAHSKVIQDASGAQATYSYTLVVLGI